MTFYFENQNQSDNLEIGSRAFIRALSRLEPLLNPHQTTRFTSFAAHNGVHQVEVTLSKKGFSLSKRREWAAPVGWTASDRAHKGTRITPLTSLRALEKEGRALENCLRDGHFRDVALLGDIAFFSIKAAHNNRALLSLKEVRRETKLLSYEIYQLLGPENEPATGDCKAAAEWLIGRLNGRLPIYLSEKELGRRGVLRAKINGQRRSYNQHIESASERWERIYLPRLPKRARISASQIIRNYLEA